MTTNMLAIFAITLKDAPKRRKHITAQLKSLGENLNLDFKTIDAIDGRTIPQAEKNRLIDKNRQKYHPTPLSQGALGCTLSHRKIWQIIANENIQMALILEDDAVLKPQAIDVLKRIQKLNGRFDIINLHHTNKRPLITVAQISKTHQLAITKYNAIATSSYVISKQAAKKLLQNTIPIRHEIDVLINRWWEHDIKTLVVRPAVAIDAELASTIGYPTQKPKWHNDPLTYRLARRINRLKDSTKKRRGFATMLKAAQMRLTGTRPQRYRLQYRLRYRLKTQTPDLTNLTDLTRE